MRRLAASLALALAACEDPAVLRVDVDVREANLAVLRAVVTRDPDGRATEVLRCDFPAGERADPGCALEDGTGRWEGGTTPLSFVLYGRARTDLLVSIEGRRALNDNAPIATSTAARLTLPDRAGGSERATLTLLARTRERTRCAAPTAIPDGGDANNDRSGLTIGQRLPDGRLEIAAAANGRFVFASVTREGETCSVTVREPVRLPTSAQTICRIRESSLVSAPLETAIDGRYLFAAECQNSIVNGEVRMVAVVYEEGVDPFPLTTTLPPALNSAQVSRPTLADLDGDGVREVIFLINRARVLTLGRWDPVRDPTTVREVALNGLTPFGQQVPHPPLIVPSPREDTREVVLIAGYPGGIGVVTGDPAGFTKLHDNPTQAIMSAGASLAELSDGYLITVTTLYPQTGLEVTVLEARQSGFSVRETFSIAVPEGVELATDIETRVAIGDIDGSGAGSAVVVHNGEAIVFPLSAGATARTFPVWRNNVQDVQTVLLANVDGLPGAEIITFDPASPLVHAIDHQGQALLDGWPIEAIQGGGLRLFVADLDAPRELRTGPDLELVTLSQRTIEVIQLGPGSYDPLATPWPFPYRDRRATGIGGPSQRDPHAAGR